ncbi:MAG: hypothetical protein OXG35_11395 [Acidobacteria bacterium]|nr:hypothetical protein [Acidobacteriota bacterium]
MKPKIIPQLEPFATGETELGIVTLTAEDALYICDYMAFERQRFIDKRHLGNLADAMEHGEWVGMSMLLFALHRGRLKLIDTQHRLRAQAEFGRRVNGPVPMRWIVQAIRKIDAAVAYSRLDAHQKKRGGNVVAMALDLDVPPIVRNAIVEAAATVERYQTETDPKVQVGASQVVIDRPHRDCVEYITERRDAIWAFGDACAVVRTRHDRIVRRALIRRGILPICLETIASRGRDALAFWRAVLCGQNADRAAIYVRDNLAQPIPDKAQKASLSRAMTVAKGWNAHLTGRVYRGKAKTLAVKETDLIIR